MIYNSKYKLNAALFLDIEKDKMINSLSMQPLYFLTNTKPI
jgi:hypothetical protein